MSHYARGRRYEYKAQQALQAEGYATTRSASSKGLWDVTAVKGERVVLVQVKSTRRPTGGWRDANVRELEALAVPPNVVKEAWVYRVGRGQPERYVLGGTDVSE